MQTDILCAFQVENNDHIVMDGEVMGYVYSIDEEGDFLYLDVVDDEAEHTVLKYGPFETVRIVTSFSEEDSYYQENWGDLDVEV
jgi:hypothetical protein